METCRAVTIASSIRIPKTPQPTPSSTSTCTPSPQLKLLPVSHLHTQAARTIHHRQHPSSRRDFFGVLAALALGLGIAADGDEGVALAAPPSCELSAAPSGLAFCDTKPGSGLEASKGMLIKANYVGKLENGQVFDSSYDRGKPLTFRVGVGQVIKGWDEGILGGDGVPPMLAGGKRTLRIPPELGYGERGAGCRGGSCLIPPNSVLLFDVEFVGKAA